MQLLEIIKTSCHQKTNEWYGEVEMDLVEQKNLLQKKQKSNNKWQTSLELMML